MTSRITETHAVTVEVGGIPVAFRTDDAAFRQVLEKRYSGFVSVESVPRVQFEIQLTDPALQIESGETLRVTLKHGRWKIKRDDFVAEWDFETGRGDIQQSANPYSVDAVLRIAHSLILAREGGFLLHASSAVKTASAFLFTGVSGAGKTTISKLAPLDVTLLTDEISYVKLDADGYRAYGTPFAGTLGKPGKNISAPIATLFFLEKGPGNQIESISKAEALRRLLRNILFFAEDKGLVNLVFQSAYDFVQRVDVKRLIFLPDQRVWELIG